MEQTFIKLNKFVFMDFFLGSNIFYLNSGRKFRVQKLNIPFCHLYVKDDINVIHLLISNKI